MSSYLSYTNSRFLVHSERFFANSEISVYSIMNRIYLFIFLFILLFVNIDLFSYDYFFTYLGAGNISNYFISCYSYDLFSFFFLLCALYFVMTHSVEYILKYINIFLGKVFDCSGRISYGLCFELVSPFLGGLLHKIWHVVLRCVIFFVCLYMVWYILFVFFYNCELYVLYKTFIVEFTHGSMNKGYTYHTTLSRILTNSKFYDVYGYFPYSPYTFCGFPMMYSVLLYLYLFKDMFYLCLILCVYVVFVQPNLKISHSWFSFFSNLYMRCISICISYIYFKNYFRRFARLVLLYFFLLGFSCFLFPYIFILIMKVYGYLLFSCHNLLENNDVLCNVYRLFDLASLDYVDIFGGRNISTDRLFWGCFEHIKYCCPIQFVNTYYLQYLGSSSFDADTLAREYVAISCHLFDSIRSSLLLFHNCVNDGYDSILLDDKCYPSVPNKMLDSFRVDLFNSSSFYNLYDDYSHYFYFDADYIVAISRSNVSWNMHEALNGLIYDCNYIPVVKCYNWDTTLDRFNRDLVNVKYGFIFAGIFSKKGEESDDFVNDYRSLLTSMSLKNLRDLFYIDRIASDHIIEEQRICRSSVDLRFLFQYIDIFKNENEVRIFVKIFHFVFCKHKDKIKEICEQEKNVLQDIQRRSKKNMLKLIKAEFEMFLIKCKYGETCEQKTNELVRAIYLGDFLNDGYVKYSDEYLFKYAYQKIDEYLKDCRSLEGNYRRDFSEIAKIVSQAKSLNASEKMLVRKMTSLFFSRISFVVVSELLKAENEKGLFEYLHKMFEVVFIRPVYFYFKYISLFHDNVFQHRHGLGEDGLLNRSYIFREIYYEAPYTYKSFIIRTYYLAKKYFKKMPVGTRHFLKKKETSKYKNLFGEFFPFYSEEDIKEMRLAIANCIRKDEYKSMLYYIRLMSRSLAWVKYIDSDLNLYGFVVKNKLSRVNYSFCTFFRSFLEKNISAQALCSKNTIRTHTSLFSGHRYLVEETLDELIPKLRKEFGEKGEKMDDTIFMFLANSFSIYIFNQNLKKVKGDITAEKFLTDNRYFDKYSDNFEKMTDEFLIEQLDGFDGFLKEKEVVNMYLFFDMLDITRGD